MWLELGEINEDDVQLNKEKKILCEIQKSEYDNWGSSGLIWEKCRRMYRVH